MRQMSFSMTTRQIRDESKTCTRREGWRDAKPGQRVVAIEKGQGLKKGEHVVRMKVIEFTDVRREPLYLVNGIGETQREGFPDMTPQEFVLMYCRANGILPPTPAHLVTRLAFKYVHDAEAKAALAGERR